MFIFVYVDFSRIASHHSSAQLCKYWPAVVDAPVDAADACASASASANATAALLSSVQLSSVESGWS